MLLGPFGLELLSPTDAPALTAVADRYGDGWTNRVLDEWDARQRRRYPATDDRRSWVASLPEFCDALAAVGGGGVALLVLKTCSSWLTAALGEARSQTQPSRRTRDLDELTDPIAGLEWPLKEQSRGHVHSRIDLQELPVQHRTRRVGRPYTLVLSKMPTLFEREEQARRDDEVDLRWIREQLNRTAADS